MLACLWSPTAHAQRPTEPIQIRFTAPEECGSLESFIDQLSARAPVRIDTAGRAFEITITPYTTGGVYGKLVVRAADGDSVRTVDGATCQDALAALTVVAALAINATPEVKRLDPVVESVTTAPIIRSAPRERWLGAGVGLAGYRGVMPDGELGARALATFGSRTQIRVALSRTAEQVTSGMEGASSFRWTAGTIDVRPILVTKGPWSLSAAAGLEVGMLQARGPIAANPAQERRPWLAPLVAARIAIRAGRFALELEGTAAAPLIRDRFFVAPSITVHQAPVITTGLGLAVVMELL